MALPGPGCETSTMLKMAGEHGLPSLHTLREMHKKAALRITRMHPFKLPNIMEKRRNSVLKHT
jgi:hypothetical protein